MKVLHLLSNWKWTERSEPAADLAAAQIAQGVEVVFACGKPPRDRRGWAWLQAREKGIEQSVMLDLPKHFSFLTFLRDCARLRRFIRETAPDVIHCHMPNAHALAAVARGTRRGPALVRGCYEPDGPERGVRSRWLYRRFADGAVFISPAAAAAAERLGVPRECILVAEPSVDTRRFAPERTIGVSRAEFGLGEGTFVVGMVTRIREARRLDLVLNAVHALSDRFPQLRLLVVGRGAGGAVERLVTGPAARMGIGDRVLPAGYCRDDRLVAAYRAMDVLAYPMPGTDASCRTVREAMAAGVPVVACSVGFLPELVRDGVNGRLVGRDGERLAETLADLMDDRPQRDALARGALETARERFAPESHARRTLAFYERVLANSTNRCLPKSTRG